MRKVPVKNTDGTQINKKNYKLARIIRKAPKGSNSMFRPNMQNQAPKKKLP